MVALLDPPPSETARIVNVFNQGRRAARAGFAYDDCDYAPGDERRMLWQLGWNAEVAFEEDRPVERVQMPIAGGQGQDSGAVVLSAIVLVTCAAVALVVGVLAAKGCAA